MGADREPPLYQQVKDALKDEIAENKHDPTEPFITQREVCARFGVSTITAVRALNDLVAEGVLVRRRGQGTFIADHATEQPQEPGDITISCIVNGLHGLHGAHMAHILTEVESVSAEHGYQLVLANSAESAEREEGALRRALRNGASGILLYPVQGQSHAEVFAQVRRAGVPLVMIDRYRPDVATDAVVFDNADLGYQLTNRLIGLGHRRIATLWGETECTSVRDRLAGHVRALHEHDLPVEPELTLLQPYEPQSDRERTAMVDALIGGPNPPTAFLCANGYVLAAAHRDLSAAGAEVELACMDDAGPYDLAPMAVAAGILPSAQMAGRAMELLAQRIGSSRPYGKARRIVLPISLREGSRTRT